MEMTGSTGGDLHWHYYFVGFIDILGQKEAFEGVDRIPGTPEETQKLIDALKKTVGFVTTFRNGFKNFYDNFQKPTQVGEKIPPEKKALFEGIRKTDVTIKGFSDFVEIYVPLVTESHFCNALNGVYAAMTASAAMFLTSLVAKHAVRGGLEVGTGLEMFPGEIYGPALNKAYELESKKADYPRIVIGDGLMDFLYSQKQSKEEGVYADYCRTMADSCLKLIIKDLDGTPILDYLGAQFRHISTPDGGKPLDFDGLISKAFAFVKEEQAKWKAQRNSRRAFGYALLINYFSARGAK